MQAGTSVVAVELSPRQVELLPHNLQVLYIPRESFTVEYVIEQYGQLVERLVSAADVASELVQVKRQQEW